MNPSLNIRENSAYDMLDAIPGIIAYINPDLDVSYVNVQFARLFGKKKEQLIGKNIREMLSPENVEALKKNIGVLNGEVIHFQSELSFRGTRGLFDVTITADYSDNSLVRGYTVFALEITGAHILSDVGGEKFQEVDQTLHDVLKENEHIYHEIIEKLPVAIYTIDREGYIQVYNKAAVDLWGREPVCGKDLWCGSWRIYRADGERLSLDECPMAVALREARPVNGEEIIIEKPDGEKVNVLPYPEPILNKNGSVIGTINMLVNITDRKKFEEKNAMLAAIVESSDDAIISKTLEGIVTSWNTAAERIFGYTASEMIGESITKIIPTERLHEEPEILSKLKAGEKIDHFETERITKYGKIINIAVTISPVKDSKGKVIGASKIARDITEQKRLIRTLNETETRFRIELEKQVSEKTEDIKLANLRLERSNQELERFAYVASHDLQEPLRKIQAFGDLLLQKNGSQLSDVGTDYLNRMIKAAHRMQHLIEALLDFSRTTTLEKKFEKKDLNLLAREVKREFQEQIDEKHATIVIEPLPEIEVIPFQFKQMLSNIVGNSLKYTKREQPPVIKITSEFIAGKDVKIRGANQQGQYCKITVQDNGIGFDNENAERIFELFQRLHGRYEYSGSGIGLSICKKIAENHKGFIVANGEKGVGASFYIYIPVAHE